MAHDKEEARTGGITNHFEAGANCQVFNGEIRGCVFAMPGAHVTQTGAGDGAADGKGEQTDDAIVGKLQLHFKDEEAAKRFLSQIKGMGDMETITLLKRYCERGLCKSTSKALWQTLYDAGLYAAQYSNWNKRMNEQ